MTHSRCGVGNTAVADQIDKHSKKIRDLKNQLEELKVRKSGRIDLVTFLNDSSYVHVLYLNASELVRSSWRR